MTRLPEWKSVGSVQYSNVERFPYVPDGTEVYLGMSYIVRSVYLSPGNDTKNLRFYLANGGQCTNFDSSTAAAFLFLQVESEDKVKIFEDSNKKFGAPFPKEGYYFGFDQIGYHNYFNNKRLKLTSFIRNHDATERVFELFVDRYY